MRLLLPYFAVVNLLPLLAARFYHQVNEETFIAAIFWALIYCFPILYTSFKRTWLVVLSSIVSVLSLLEISHVFLFQGRITANTFFIIFDTNINETKDFLFDQLNWGLIFVMVAFIVGNIFWVVKIFKNLPTLKIPSIKKYFAFGLIVPLLIFPIFHKFNPEKSFRSYRESNTLAKLITAKVRYDEEIAKMENIQTLFSAKSSTKERNLLNHSKRTHVIIIGESTSRYKMGLYGYFRANTPNLVRMKNDLVVLENGFCSDPPGTRENLKKILSFINSENQKTVPLDTHLIKMMKDVGYKTIWISNQVTSGRNNNTTAVIGKTSDIAYFINTSDNSSYDEKLIPLLEKSLQDPAPKKLVILHLAGTHMKYRERYPKKFKTYSTYDDIPKSKYLSGKNRDYYNEYDNSVLYNDYIVGKMLDVVSKNPDTKSALYLSDHGEEVYDTQNFHGHPSESVTPHMFAIPMIFWFSKDMNTYRQGLQKHIKTQVVSDDIIHSLLDIYELDHERYDSKKSLLSGQFLPKDIHPKAAWK